MNTNNKSHALNLVTRIHAQKMTKRGLESDCDCLLHVRFGILTVGPKCAEARISFLNKEKMRPGHTQKTGGAASRARLKRSQLRGAIWGAESDTARRTAESDYQDSLSEEYKAQLTGVPYNHRKKASGESAVKLGLAA